MEGQVALITGAGGGLGKAFAEILLDNGAKICIAEISEELGRQAEKELRDKYGNDRVFFHRSDVTSKDSFEESFKKAVEVFGKLDILVNNAGMMHEKLWEKMLDINLNGTIRGSYLGLEYIGTPRGKGGVIINIASAAGLIPRAYGPGYSTSKAGVIAFSRSLGQVSLQQNKVRVNCLCPTLADTAFIQVQESQVYADGAKVVQQMKSKAGVMTTTEVAEAFLELVQHPDSGQVMAVAKGHRDLLKMPTTMEHLRDMSKII